MRRPALTRPSQVTSEKRAGTSAVKPHSLHRHFVDVRGLNHLPAVTAQIAAAQIIGENINEIRLLFCLSSQGGQNGNHYTCDVFKLYQFKTSPTFSSRR